MRKGKSSWKVVIWLTLFSIVLTIVTPVQLFFDSTSAYAATTPLSEDFDSVSTGTGISSPQIINDWTFSMVSTVGGAPRTQIRKVSPNFTNDLLFLGNFQASASEYGRVQSNTGAFKLNSFQVIERNSTPNNYRIVGYLIGNLVDGAEKTFSPPTGSFYTVDVSNDPAWQNIDEFRIYANETIKLDFDDLIVSEPVVADSTAPTAGNGGEISSADITASGAKLIWAKATDGITAQSDLEYQVYQSDSNNIDTISNIEENGILLGSGFTKDISSFDVTSLSPNTTYYFNVIVKDQSGNKSAYSMKQVTTHSEVSVPGIIVTIGNVKIGKGLTGEIPVSINTPPTGIGSYGIQIDYDPAVLEILKIIPNSPDDLGFYSNIPKEENWFKAGWVDIFDEDSLITNETELFKIKVKVKLGAELGNSFMTVDKSKKENLNFNDFDIKDIHSDVINGAVQVVNSYNVHFEVDGGSSIDSQLIQEDRKVSKPEDPIKEGYSFAGWYKDNEYTTEFDFNTAVNGDITLYAKWENERSSDAALSNLTISPFAFTEPFASDKENYFAAVPYGTEKVNVHATATDPNASISINNINSESQEVTLDPDGSTTISVLVTAANGTKKTYTITVNETAYEASSNADLSALSFSDQISLTEFFDKEKLNYEANITQPPAGPVTLTATKSDSKAQVAYKLNDEQSTDTLELSPGKNKVEVIVTAEDGTVKTYTVMITVGLKGDADVDGDVDIFDWQETARFILNKKKPSSQAKWNADINHDNNVGIGDWVLIANMLLN
ncbi:cadherin-like beta sandwich domain-containing protein [Bacillus sp. S/N-304-OC-R1]|uniref:cadherin-like beta sandwich domain-containing protein n=1 Tax=Bacillus sp. S/N-304-OC-R1 TaxID=2758034 RepID=UPI001C8D7E64|nr:cadherin-like beta sandwich domain-containing protein [Bacillus sp. S/N-304-OC-R1]MBY0121148.1 cadherin-like beta sandwich domain-containing protein [Bacillus sp. S/N-304-OC-R1]